MEWKIGMWSGKCLAQKDRMSTRTHDRLCRLSVYADSESTQAALDPPPFAPACVS